VIRRGHADAAVVYLTDDMRYEWCGVGTGERGTGGAGSARKPYYLSEAQQKRRLQLDDRSE